MKCDECGTETGLLCEYFTCDCTLCSECEPKLGHQNVVCPYEKELGQQKEESRDD